MCKKIIAYDKNHEWIGSVEFISYKREIWDYCLPPRHLLYSENVYSYEIYYPAPDYMTHDFAVQIPYAGDKPTYRNMYSYLRKVIPHEIHHVIVE